MNECRERGEKVEKALIYPLPKVEKEHSKYSRKYQLRLGIKSSFMNNTDKLDTNM